MVKQGFIILFLLAACSSLSHNQISKTEVGFTSGVAQSNSWDDVLIFKRISWFYGVKLSFDLLYWQADQVSPFSQWFSADEKELLLKCYPLLIGVSYSGDGDNFSQAMMKMEMEKNGFKNVSVSEFARNLKSHPHYFKWNLKRYKVEGFCRSQEKSIKGRYVYISVPGFKQTFLEL